MIKRMVLTALLAGAMTIVLAACCQEEVAPEASQVTQADHTEASTQDVHDTEAHASAEALNASAPAGTAGRTSAEGVQELVALPGGDLPPIIVNVWFDGSGVWPKQVSVPVNRQVQLVMRNHDVEEHHYHILGMPTVGMLWLSKEGEMSSVSDVTEEEHAMHHPEVNMVPFHICTSRSGICPTGQWIHAHADPADMDIVVFVTDTTGSYEVTDPLHPDVKAMVNVF